MKSNSDRISRQEEVSELFEQLGKKLSKAIPLLVIGGAAMMEYGLKDSTKDIDIVCRNEKDKEEILRCSQEMGYDLVWPEKRHARLGLNRIAIKGGHALDVFAGKISYDFQLSETMWERARKLRDFGNADLRYASPEDIFIMKLIANRPGDAPDCAALVSVGLDFDAIYEEIKSQYNKDSGQSKQKIWITYIEEGIARLEDQGLTTPIGDKISLLAFEYNEKLWEDSSKPGIQD
jgi:hypothetical protein